MAAPFVLIAKLLRKKLATLSSPPVIFWENVGKDKTTNVTHLVPRLIPARGQLLDVERRQINTGIYSIGVYVAIGEGEAKLLALLDAIYTLFSDTMSLSESSFRIDLMVINRSEIRRDNNFSMANVDIEFVNYN